jgi:hypothetical protein
MTAKTTNGFLKRWRPWFGLDNAGAPCQSSLKAGLMDRIILVMVFGGGPSS